MTPVLDGTVAHVHTQILYRRTVLHTENKQKPVNTALASGGYQFVAIHVQQCMVDVGAMLKYKELGT